MINKSVRLTLTLTASLLSVGAVPAFATTIMPGMTGPTAVAPSVTTLGTYTTVATTGMQTVTAPTFTATYTESIIKTASNPFGANDLTFIMSFNNLSTSHDNLHRGANGNGNLGGFLGYSADVDYVAGSGAIPNTADFSPDFGTIGFNFSGVTPGQTSDTLVIYTNATNYQMGYFTLTDSVSGFGPGFIPAAATSTTPEPSSLVLLGTGLVGLAGAARRRFKL